MINKDIVIREKGVKANKRFGKIRYLLGKYVSNRIFGNPFHMAITLRDEFGNIKEQRKVWNTVTSAGKNGIADQLLASPTIGVPTHMAVGTGTPSATALGTETDRNALTSKTRSTNVVTFVGDWAAGDATAALTEAGVFNAASSGDMYLSTSFSVINKGANDTLNISWDLTIN